ncbi:glycoside hydrolase family 5 protein [Georgenia deserti]|uniref:Glycoside hydrolase family 5 protein n=1 Tax=Georgenia deserti TaxID=2093781 RepID=A0ABW4L2B9_9MICO
MERRRLRTGGDRMVDGDGDVIRLRGFGLGGWMTMENFITGHPATESQTRRAMRRVLGEDAYEAFFETFLASFFGEDDAEYLAWLGVNCLRVPFSYHHFEDDAAPFELREEGFRHLERVVRLCAGRGIYTVLDLHAAPGYQNQNWHSDNPTHWAHFWRHRHFQDRVVHLWEALAERFADEPMVAGYNLLNEPADPSGEVVGPFYERLAHAVRAVDPHHTLFLDGNTYATDFTALADLAELDNVVFTAHDYALPGIANPSRYPGQTRGRHFDRGIVEESFLRRTEFMRSTGTPIWVGEFGPLYTGDARRDGEVLLLLDDQLDIYDAHGAGWSLWTYKDIGTQGVVHADPDGPYLSRIRPALEKKRRLGTDSWGGSEEQIRHVLEPIEQLVATEFPDFDPYPWGSKQWINLLVRHVLLAEPLVDEFAECFRGADPVEAAELAASFEFGTCVRREPLEQVLRARLR